MDKGANGAGPIRGPYGACVVLLFVLIKNGELRVIDHS